MDGPVPAEMVRAIPRILRDPLDFLAAVVARYGDLAAFPMPRTPVLLLNDPAGARRVLLDNHRGYGKQTVQYRALSAVTGGGLLTLDGEQWRSHRRVLQPSFRPGGGAAPDRVAVEAVAAAGRLRERWDARPEGGAWDAEPAVLAAMLEVIGRLLFDEDLAPVGRRVVGAVDVALRHVVRQARSPLPARLPTPGRLRLRRAVADLDVVVAEAVRRRLDRGIEAGDGDLLAVLLRAEQLSRPEVRDELVTLIIAGHETVASALCWALALLAEHPAVQDRLHAELDRVLAGRSPTAADLPALSYTQAVFAEALRLYPPAWVLTRRALADDEVAGVPIPAGTLLLISPWLLHRRPQAWPDPERFDPGRFLPAGGGADQSVAEAGAPGPSPGEGCAAAGRPGPGDYLPFGAGPRQCIGREVALVEGALVLAELLRERQLRWPPGVCLPRPDAQVTLRPRGGLPLLLGPR